MRTASGVVVEGDVRYAGDRRRDLLLGKPPLRDGSGNVLRRIGRYTSIPAEQIARIDPRTGLRNWRTIEQDPEPAPAPTGSERESDVVARGAPETEAGTLLGVAVETPSATDCSVEALSRFLDVRGATLEERTAVVPVPDPGEKRAFVTRYEGEPAGEVVDHDVSVSGAPPPDWRPLAGWGRPGPACARTAAGGREGRRREGEELDAAARPSRAPGSAGDALGPADHRSRAPGRASRTSSRISRPVTLSRGSLSFPQSSLITQSGQPRRRPQSQSARCSRVRAASASNCS